MSREHDGDGHTLTGQGLATLLEDRATEITERWHHELRQRLNVRPQNVFPGPELLDGMPALIRWIASTLRNGRQLAPEQERSAHDLAQFWHRAGFSVEEALLHVRILGGILHGALREAVAEATDPITPLDAAASAERLCASLSRVETVLVGTYRDEEEERFADFGGTLAHEIRGQLNVAMTAAELLQVAGADASGPVDAQRHEAIERITGAIRAAGDLVTAVRRFSRARSGFGEWTMVPFDQVVDSVVDRLRQESDAGVGVEVDSNVPSTPIPSEAVQLALHNLVENAIKYADPDKPDRWVRVNVRPEAEQRRWLVQIGDNGIGVPETEQQHIFNRFLRGSRAAGNGYGLGLSIARQAVLSIGGTVMLESEEGEGSTFSFTVPFDEAGLDLAG